MAPRVVALSGLAALVFPPLSHCHRLWESPHPNTTHTLWLLSEELVSSVGGTPPSFFLPLLPRLTHNILHLQDLIRSSDETN